MTTQPQTQPKQPLNVYSLNTCRSNEVCHAALHLASTHTRDFDIILFQEPWWGNSATPGVRIPPNIQGWTPILPTFRKIPGDSRPRVMAYIRKESQIKFEIRTDLIDDLDIQIIDVRRNGENLPTRLVNIYNNADPEDDLYSVDRLRRIALDPMVPTILTGDWNLHHPQFRSMHNGRNADQRAVETAEWLTTNSFELRNEFNQPTWRKEMVGENGQTQIIESALDFTFANWLTNESHILQHWTIEPDQNASSDHFATFFSIVRDGDELVNITDTPYTIRDMPVDKYLKAAAEELQHSDPTGYAEAFRPLRERDTTRPTPQNLDTAAEFLINALKRAVRRTAPERKPSTRGKIYWTPKLTKATEDKIDARKAMRASADAQGGCDTVLAQTYRHFKAVVSRLDRKTKRDFYRKKIKEVSKKNFWDLLKWTKGSRQYPTPALSRGNNQPVATTHDEKCNVLREVLLPAPPTLANPPTVTLDPLPNELEWHEVSRNEVHTALFAADPDNAPGPSGLTGRAYQLAWQVAEEEIYLLLSSAAMIGHHPRPFRESICVALRKPKKDDYSLPKSYRPIQLLEVLGKALERIQAERLSYIAMKYNLIPPSHFGGVKGKSAEDALLASVHDIKAARNLGLAASALTFDISGFFNNVSHPILLDTLR